MSYIKINALSILFNFTMVIFTITTCVSLEGREIRNKQTPILCNEVWGYLMSGEEHRLKGDESITDIGFFTAGISARGELKGAHKPRAIPAPLKGKVRFHMVVAELGNHALIHFTIHPDLPFRKRFLEQIISASDSFDGIQIDFESVLPDDADAFHSFLKELKSLMPKEKILSIALPARNRKIDDAYNYEIIAEIVDRIIILSYDEHWSTSSPGPIASIPWCQKIAQYAKKIIPGHKLIMGIPLYGRAWQETKLHRALKYDQVKAIIKKVDEPIQYSAKTGPYFEYHSKVKVKVYYEDHRSLYEKITLYQNMGIKNYAFWRIGQGPSDFWEIILPGKNIGMD